MGGYAFPNIDAAIARMEGFGTPNVTPTIANNPGDLIYGPFAVNHGATGQTTNGFAIFPTVAAGTGAEDALVQYYSNQGATLGSLLNAWNPPTAPGNSPATTSAYAQNIANILGVSLDTPVPDAEKGISTSTPPGNQPPILPQNTASVLGDLGSLLSGGLVPGFNLSSTWSRIAGLLLALILIAVGIALFKPVSKIVVNTGRKAIAAAM
jgi:hypothetical protein